MGRPIGGVNRAKPFTDMLRVALLSGDGRRLRIIAEKLGEKAEQATYRPSVKSATGWMERLCGQLSTAMPQSRL